MWVGKGVRKNGLKGLGRVGKGLGEVVGRMLEWRLERGVEGVGKALFGTGGWKGFGMGLRKDVGMSWKGGWQRDWQGCWQ